MSDVTVETLQAEIDAAQALADITQADADLARVTELKAELTAAQAPPAVPPSVDNDHVEPGAEQFTEPVAGPKPRPYIPNTGAQIGTFLAAAANNMPNLYEASEAEVDAFVAGHK